MEKLGKIYQDKITPELKKELGYSNIFEVPKITKIVVSAGVGDFKDDKNQIELISNEIAMITGAKPKINLSRKAVSAFKLRIGQPVGITTTLRGERMYDFLSKLINVTLPRIRDFHGISAESFDGQGNYSLGIKDYSIFPEVKFEEIKTVFGLEVNIRIRAKKKDDAKLLLTKIGFPFMKGNK